MNDLNGNDLPLDDERESTPLRALWILYLFFKPRTFFRYFATESNPTLTAVCAWFFGMSGVINRIGVRETQGREVPFDDNWVLRLLFIAGTGIVSGAIFFGLGGWWYRVRLGWAGALRADHMLARRVYLFASQIIAVPIQLGTALETIFHDSPAAANMAEGSVWWLLILICPFWACLVSTVGVWTLFEVRRGAAAVWFLILPWAIYLLFYIPFFTLLLTGSDLLAHPVIKSPKMHQSEGLSFSYPGNWIIDETKNYYDPDCCVAVEPILADAIVKIQVYSSDEAAEDELDTTVANYAQSIDNMETERSSATMGPFEGTCLSGTGTMSGNTYVMRFFISRLESGAYLEIHELSLEKQEDALKEGFELIYDTLRVDG